MIFIPVQHPALLPRHSSPGKQAILEHSLSGQSQFLWRTVITSGSVCRIYCLRRGGWAWEEWQIGKKNIDLDIFLNIKSDYLSRIWVLWLPSLASVGSLIHTHRSPVFQEAHLSIGLGSQCSSLLFLNCCLDFLVWSQSWLVTLPLLDDCWSADEICYYCHALLAQLGVSGCYSCTFWVVLTTLWELNVSSRCP